MNFRERAWAKPLVGALVIVVAALAVFITFVVTSHPTYAPPPAHPSHTIQQPVNTNPPAQPQSTLTVVCIPGGQVQWKALNTTNHTITLYNISGGYDNGNTFLKTIPGGISIPPGDAATGSWTPLQSNQTAGRCYVQGYNISPLPANWTEAPNETFATVGGPNS